MSKKVKIAIIGIRGIPANYGGFETCAEKTSERFVDHFDVYVFCRRHNITLNADTYKGVHLVKVPSLKLKSFDTLSHTFLCALYIIFKPSIKIVHIYNAANAIFIPFLIFFGKKVLISVDGLEWKRPKWGRLGKRHYKISEYICSNMAHAVIADSMVIKNYYDNKFNINSVYIPYGADDLEEDSESCLEKFNVKARKYFLFVGRLVPDKGVHNLIKAYNQLETDIDLAIVGDDFSHIEYIEELKRTANDKVKFLGFVYGKDYATLNKYAFCYVSASLIEGTSPALVNAMGAGNCVLVNGIPENIETLGGTGFHYKENDIDDLVLKMKMLINQPNIIEKTGNDCRERVQKVYNWDKVALQYMTIFNNLLSD